MRLMKPHFGPKPKRILAGGRNFYGGKNLNLVEKMLGNAAQKKFSGAKKPEMKKEGGILRSQLLRTSAMARERMVKEFGNPIRRAVQLEAKLRLAMESGNFGEARKILAEIGENARHLQAYAEMLGKKSNSAKALERQLRILREYEQKLNGK